ncbi:flagellar basal body P-ring formation chaperone FlgA [Hyphococcus luteus]|jgi:flagella basal body P-ring formation protein FlgA|uniref:Flagella basal body P-ring formation protein FlgA n=1 Tax=Hyphococcus luteus TaxID=2058213 RepID=A0A2S7K4Q3_9PROT|nr:flagellar basal body P-ring formation chaperone FlgA [Marinicaulis flavus]PQA87418.1 flagella basal body P-ring formation protein FlgA [Marinicaulis flavus]
MKRALFTTAVLFAAIAPGAAQDLAALAPTPQNVANSAKGDIPMSSVMPVKQKPAVVKAAHNLRAGTVLHASDLIAEGEDADALDLFVGMELKRALYKGVKLSPNDVGLPTAVQRNAIVTLEFVRGPLMITTEGRALDAGAVGEAVRVMNLNSKTILTAVITGPNKAVAK